MKKTHKAEITRMRSEGISYSKISKALNIPVSTIKSFCQAALKSKPEVLKRCHSCEKKLKASTQSGVKRFCSDACRMAWWKQHPELINRRAVHTLTCACCGCAFEAYINGNRKYCSRACYGRSKAVGI